MTLSYLSQDTEINIINQLIPYLDNKQFVDIGAEKGSFAHTLLQQGMSGVLFEPMPKHIQLLEDLVREYPDAHLMKCAITDIDSFQTFNVATDAEGNELDYYHSLQKAHADGVFEHSKSFEVECRSIESLVKEHKIPLMLGILKTDTEGNDLKVLRGLGELRPELIVCEYFCDGLYDGWSEGSPEAMIQYMSALGYSSYLAIKRRDNLEFVATGPTLFQDKQWGNLFFFRTDFYQKTQLIIAQCLLQNEKAISEQSILQTNQLAEKENVIQALQSAKKHRPFRNSKKLAWLKHFFNNSKS